MTTSAADARTGWRAVDIVVASVLGVAFGVVFWQWNVIWTPLFAAQVNPLAYLVSGMWLVPGVLAMLIIRKPGAAIFAEMVAAGVSALLGSTWGADTLLSGFVQGAGAEIVFAATRYRSWTFPVLALAALGSAAAAWIHDWIIWYPTIDPTIQVVRGVFMVVSAVVIVAGGSILLHRALKRAGVLEGFPG
jgi:energy-coupling factor transport system substrate-specific component